MYPSALLMRRAKKRALTAVLLLRVCDPVGYGHAALSVESYTGWELLLVGCCWDFSTTSRTVRTAPVPDAVTDITLDALVYFVLKNTDQHHPDCLQRSFTAPPPKIETAS